MNTKLFSSLGLAVALAISAQPAVAQRAPAAAPAGPIVPGLGVANIDAIRVNSNAYRVAEQQRTTTYQSVVDQANTRTAAIQAQLAPLVQRFERDRAAPTANTPAGQASLQTQYQQIQQIQQSGQQEIQQILMPVQMSKAYVDEQINEKLPEAVQAATARRRITMLISPDVILQADNAYNMNQEILNDLNRLVPSVQIVPPQGWVPREVREQQAAQAAQAAAAAGQTAPAQPAGTPAPAPAPAGPLPDGR